MAVVTPTSGEEVAAVLGEASGRGQRLRIAGGGTGSRRGPAPGDDDLTLSTESLSGIVDHVPADLTITVGAGLAVSELEAHLATHGQEWPQHGALPGASVGGVLARAASGPRRLAHGPVRDSLLEVVLATGQGRLVRGGGRTVKNVSGYDIPRLVVGSWGALGVMTQVTLKLWPTPARREWFSLSGSHSDRSSVATDALARGASSVVWGPGELWVEREGQPEDVLAPERASPGSAPGEIDGESLLSGGVAPGAVPDLARWAEGFGWDYRALGGVGTFTVAVPDAEGAQLVIDHAGSLGGHAEIIDAPVSVRQRITAPAPVGLSIMKRLKSSFDPAGVINPGVLGEGL